MREWLALDGATERWVALAKESRAYVGR